MISKTVKTIDFDVLMGFTPKPRIKILSVNALADADAEHQAQVLIDGYKNLNDMVTSARARNVAQMRIALAGK